MTPMNPIEFPFWAIVQVLKNGLLLGEALGFPEMARLAVDPARLRRALQRNVRRIVEAALAFLPALGIEVLAGKPEDLDAHLPPRKPGVLGPIALAGRLCHNAGSGASGGLAGSYFGEEGCTFISTARAAAGS